MQIIDKNDGIFSNKHKNVCFQWKMTVFYCITQVINLYTNYKLIFCDNISFYWFSGAVV